jgi:hypothetical protein
MKTIETNYEYHCTDCLNDCRFNNEDVEDMINSDLEEAKGDWNNLHCVKVLDIYKSILFNRLILAGSIGKNESIESYNIQELVKMIDYYEGYLNYLD